MARGVSGRRAPAPTPSRSSRQAVRLLHQRSRGGSPNQLPRRRSARAHTVRAAGCELSFNKTTFALALIAASDGAWVAPQYIVEGLDWLAGILVTDAATG